MPQKGMEETIMDSMLKNKIMGVVFAILGVILVLLIVGSAGMVSIINTDICMPRASM